MEPLDRLGRPLRDLRISVTDRCNFRCTYCMPKEVYGRDYAFLPRDQVLSFEEIARAARTVGGSGTDYLALIGRLLQMNRAAAGKERDAAADGEPRGYLAASPDLSGTPGRPPGGSIILP